MWLVNEIIIAMSDKMQRARQRAAGVALKAATKAEDVTGESLAPEKRTICDKGANGLMADNRA